MNQNDASRLLPPGVRWALWLAVLIVAILQFGRGEFGFFAVGQIAILIAIGVAFQAIERRTRRPLKNYLRAVLASAVLALALVVMPLQMGTGLWIGLILWLGLSGMGLAWVHFYERTEPR